jgi:hypothetical protein
MSKRRMIILVETMKGTDGDYSIPAITESLIMDVFPILVEKRTLGTTRKFNALKVSKPEIVEVKIRWSLLPKRRSSSF